jgi:condensin complex subunit 2
VEDTTVDEVSSLSLLPSSSGVNTVNTFNFQKASCTLDASVKIYSYRVDDTWNSSFKILENLSRTEEKHPAENDDRTYKG